MSEQSWLIPDAVPDETTPPMAPAPTGPPLPPPAARVQRAERYQVQILPASLDALLAPEHPVRGIWEFVERLDLSAYRAAIDAVEGHAGRPAIDPAILLTLWVYAISQGVGSARELARLCEEHVAYRWVCGGVGVTRTPLSAFRVVHGDAIDRLLTQVVAVLMEQGLVELARTAQDGVRVRAGAGGPSFRRRPSLQQCLAAAAERVATLRAELEADPADGTRRQAAARTRAAADRAARVQEALRQWDDVRARRERKQKKDDDPEAKVRVSTTDPDARVMKMADGGFRPAFNVQFTADTPSQIVVGVAVTNAGGDQGQMAPMLAQLEQRYGRRPREHLVDAGFANLDALTAAARAGCTVYSPEVLPKNRRYQPGDPHPGDTPEVAAWRRYMQTDAAKAIYRERPGTIECVNAQARNRGLVHFVVRGLARVRAVATLHAVAHNILRAIGLLRARATAPAAVPA